MFGKRGSIVPGNLLDRVTDHHKKLAEFDPPDSIVQNDVPQLSWETLLLIAKKAMVESSSFDTLDFSDVVQSFSWTIQLQDWTHPGNNSIEDYHFESFGSEKTDDSIPAEVSKGILRMAETFDPENYPELFTNEVLERAQRELDMCSDIVQSFKELENLYHNLKPYHGSLSTAITYIQNAEHILDDEDIFI